MELVDGLCLVYDTNGRYISSKNRRCGEMGHVIWISAKLRILMADVKMTTTWSGGVSYIPVYITPPNPSCCCGCRENIYTIYYKEAIHIHIYSIHSHFLIQQITSE